MNQPLSVAIDMMGGDRGIPVTVPAVIQALAHYPLVHFFLIGNEDLLEKFIRRYRRLDRSRLTICHASEVVGMAESPALALKNKKDSSMRVAIDLVKQGKASACVSAGNTGALMATSRFVLKTIAGVDRPAIVYAMPAVNPLTKERSSTFMLDLGANVECSAEHLFQFAVMGSVLCETITKCSSPRVALLNIGEEEGKGLEVIKEAARLLTESQVVNYTGFIEADKIFTGKADVIVCDGFIGNIALKAVEGTVKFLSSTIKETVSSRWYLQFFALFAWPALLKIKSRLNIKSCNGASFLGLKGVVIKSHGGADAEAFLSAIGVAIHEAEKDLPNQISNRLSSLLDPLNFKNKK